MATSPRQALAVLAIVTTVMAPVVAPWTPVGATSKNEQIQSLREQVEEASAEEALLLDRLDEARAVRRDLDARVAEVDGLLEAQQEDVDEVSTRLDDGQAELNHVRNRLALARAAAAEARTELRERVVAAYVSDPGAHAANLLLSVSSPRELANSRAYLEAVVRAQQESLQHYRKLRARATRIEADVEAKVREVKTTYDDVVAERNLLQVRRQQQDALRQEALRHEEQERALLAEVDARKGDLEAQIAALQGESFTIEAMLRQRARDGVAPGPSPGRFAQPLPGAAVTSPFGPRVHPIFGTVRRHNGIDLRGSWGTPIRAAGAGEVVWSGPRGGYGNTVIIDHGDGLATLYAHQSSIEVTTGDVIETGRVVGRVGATGFATGPHLHFEVRAAGRPVDPLGYL